MNIIELNSHRKHVDRVGVNLYAVTHETKGMYAWTLFKNTTVVIHSFIKAIAQDDAYLPAFSLNLKHSPVENK